MEHKQNCTPIGRSGIAIAGNVVTDFVKVIDSYPEKGMLSSITAIDRAVGGCVCNTLIDLATMDPALPLQAFGMVGDDESGRFVTAQMQERGIDVDGIAVSETHATSFSDVMSVASTGERTFFHHRGANAAFSPAHIAVDKLSCRMLHVGYILLLDAFDAPDAQYGTVMARFLHDVQQAGIQTSIDVVSESGKRFAEKVIPALRYTDNAIMNEIEGCGVSGLAPRDAEGKLIVENVVATLEQILACGVRERAIIHCPEAGFCLGREQGLTIVPSLKLPSGYIKGSVGAGDAFGAGCLYGIYNGYSDREMLEFASGAAACNLAAAESVGGMRSSREIWEMIRNTEKISL